MECGLKIIRILVFVFNFIFFITGLAMMVAGGLALASEVIGDYENIIEGNFTALAIVMIIVGVIIMFIAFLGCCGAWKQSYFMLMAYAVCLLVILIVELALGIAAFVKKDEAEDEIKKAARKTMNKYLDEDDSFARAWNVTQRELKCCGIDGPADWRDVSPFNTGGPPRYPDGCCQQYAENCAALNAPAYNIGCVDKVKEELSTAGSNLGIVGIVLALVEIFGIIFACCLARAVKDAA